MAQHDYVIANGTGAAVRSDINNGLAAIVSNNSGATAPSTTYAYMLWADTSTNLLKLRNGANSAWITVGDLTAANLGLAALASPTFTGTVTIPTATISTGAGIPLASAASPAIYFTGDTNTGIYSPGADQFAITTGGSGRLFVDSSGRVGLGTSSPGSLLDVGSGSAGVTTQITLKGGTGSGDYGIFSIQNGSTAKGRLVADAAANELRIDTSGGASTKIQFKTGSSYTDAVTIDASQRVGIGTTSPGYKLDVYHASNGNGWAFNPGNLTTTNSLYSLKNSGSGLATARHEASDYHFIVGNSEAARLDTSGRLLVGTSSDVSGEAAALIQSVYSTGALTSIGRDDTTVNNGDFIGGIDFHTKTGASSTWQRSARILCWADADQGSGDAPGRLTFSTTADGASSPTERMRITNGGNLCINSTGSDNSTSGPLCITGRFAQGMSTWNIGSNGFPALYFNNASLSKVGDIVVNSGGTAYNTTSDYRLKENVVPLTSAVNRVNQLQVHRFNFIADPDKTVDGFIAHEAQAVVPECVTGTKDEVDADGNPVYQGIDQSKLVPLLTAALQEALAEIESLKARVTALEP